MKFSKKLQRPVTLCLLEGKEEHKDENPIIQNFLDDEKQKVFVLPTQSPKAYLKLKERSPKLLITAGFLLSKELAKMGLKEVSLKDLPLSEDELVYLLEGFLQAEYNFDKYLSQKNPVHELTVDVKETKKIKERIHVMEGVFLGRDLINIPSCDLTPEALAQTAVDALSPLGVEVEVFDENQIQQMNMKAFWSVAMGSDKPPRFIVMKWLPLKDKAPIALVGKGLTYDSGGYCIKPANSMETMSGDMGGAATMIGTMYAIAKNKVKKNVVAFVAACENLISGKAYKTGDVVSSLSGKSIYIGNTDAEGRVTLADSLYYAATQYDPKFIIDAATLTGACIVALGSEYTGVVTNDDQLYEKLRSASALHDEKVWQLPSDDNFREALKTPLADLANVTKVGAGTITAGLFLEEFVEGKRWMHLDIAGTSDSDKAKEYLPRGGNATLVKSLYQLVKDDK